MNRLISATPLMRFARSLMIPALLVLHSSGLVAQSAATPEDTLSLALEQFATLEVTVGRSNPLMLAEPLYQIAEEYRRLGRYAEAHSALDRGQQIVRIAGGLYVREQIPYIEKKIENFADWGNWQDSRDLLDHLLWLHHTKSPQIDAPLLNDLMDLVRLHLRGVSDDLTEYRTYHFRKARMINTLAVSSAELLWNRTDPRLVPMLYSLLHQIYLQAIAVEEGGRTGYELRQIVPGTDWVREKPDQKRFFYETGMRLLLQIEDIFSTPGQDNAEALAMTQVYRADWQLMFSRNEQALESYELAFNQLLAAGVSQELANHYFAAASLLPNREFHTSVAAALAARAAEPDPASLIAETAALAAVTEPDSTSSSTETNAPAAPATEPNPTSSSTETNAPAALATEPNPTNPNDETDAQATLYFAEWSENFPHVQTPFAQQPTDSLDSNILLFSVDVTGISEQTRWLSRQTVQELGVPLNVNLLRSEPGAIPFGDQQDIIEKILELDIRPRLVDGKPQDSSAILIYRPAHQLPIPISQ